MSRTAEEAEAIKKDIEKGLEQIHQQLVGWHKAFPLVIENLNPHSTSTRKLLAINTQIIELGLDVQRVLRTGIIVKKG